jgi:MFS family permease
LRAHAERASAPAYNANRLFLASCIALVTTAMSFSIRGNILDALSAQFQMNKEQTGMVGGAWTWGFALSILFGGPIVDALGMRRFLFLACACHIVGVAMTIFAPSVPVLLAATVITGMGNGIVEAVINPLCATVYSDNKTHKLNVLHAWWPGGLIVGGLLALALDQVGAGWQIKFGTILVAAVAYGVLIIGQEFPNTERVASGVSNAEMWREAARPMFLLWILCMVFTAATELAPDTWVSSVLEKNVGISGTWLLVYTAGLMFVLRFYAGPLVHKFSPLGVLLFSAILSGIGLYGLSFVQATEGGSNAGAIALAFVPATIFGIGKTYFWPTMLGVTSERFPKGGSLLMGLMGGAGVISVGYVTTWMGKIYDEHGASASFQAVALFPVILIVIFGGLYVYYQKQGGYKALVLVEGREVEVGAQ